MNTLLAPRFVCVLSTLVKIFPAFSQIHSSWVIWAVYLLMFNLGPRWPAAVAIGQVKSMFIRLALRWRQPVILAFHPAQPFSERSYSRPYSFPDLWNSPWSLVAPSGLKRGCETWSLR